MKAMPAIHTAMAASDMLKNISPRYNSISLKYTGCRTIPKTPFRINSGFFLTSPNNLDMPSHARYPDVTNIKTPSVILTARGTYSLRKEEYLKNKESVIQTAKKRKNSISWPASPKGCSPVRSSRCRRIFS